MKLSPPELSINKEQIKVVAFDAFDTLFQYTKSPQSHNMGAYAFLLKNAALSSQERKERTHKMMTKNDTFSDIAGQINNRYGNLSIKDIENTYHLLQNELRSMQFYNDAIPTLNAIKAKGYKTAIISNLAKPYGEALYSHLNHIDSVAFSYEIGHKKPEQAIFQRVADQQKTALHEILMIGNHPNNDLKSPREYGLQSILLDRHNNEKTIHTNKIAQLTELITLL